MPETSPPRFYFPELDGLRFFAFLMVFIHHTPPLSLIQLSIVLHEYGWIGVDLFLCLSAFLISRLLSTEFYRDGKINHRNFLVRRALRIWPIYFIFITIVYFFIARNAELDRANLLHLVGFATFTENIVSTFIGYAPNLLVVHLWTISYEFQFYLLAPLLVISLLRINQHKKLGYIITIFVTGTLIRAFLINSQIPHPAIWVLPITHFESILGGLILGLGMLDEHLQKFRVWHLSILATASLISISLLPNFYEIGWGLMLTYPLAGIGVTLLLYSALHSGQSIPGRIIKNDITVYLGKISYGLYVYHLAGQYFAHHICAAFGLDSANIVGYTIGMFFTAITLTILVSAASYHWVEIPFLRLRLQFTSVRSRPL